MKLWVKILINIVLFLVLPTIIALIVMWLIRKKKRNTSEVDENKELLDFSTNDVVEEDNFPIDLDNKTSVANFIKGLSEAKRKVVKVSAQKIKEMFETNKYNDTTFISETNYMTDKQLVFFAWIWKIAFNESFIDLVLKKRYSVNSIAFANNLKTMVI